MEILQQTCWTFFAPDLTYSPMQWLLNNRCAYQSLIIKLYGGRWDEEKMIMIRIIKLLDFMVCCASKVAKALHQGRFSLIHSKGVGRKIWPSFFSFHQKDQITLFVFFAPCYKANLFNMHISDGGFCYHSKKLGQSAVKMLSGWTQVATKKIIHKKMIAETKSFGFMGVSVTPFWPECAPGADIFVQ